MPITKAKHDQMWIYNFNKSVLNKYLNYSGKMKPKSAFEGILHVHTKIIVCFSFNSMFCELWLRESYGD